MYGWRKLQQALTGNGNAPAAVAPKAPDPAALKPLPEDAIALVPLRNMVMFPGVIAPVTIGRRRSVAAAQEAARTESRVGFLLQRDAGENDPKQDDLHWVGTAGQVLRYVTGGEGAHHLVVQGQSRFRVLEFLDGWPFLVGRVQYVEEGQVSGPELEARFHQLRTLAGEAIELLPNAPDGLAAVVRGIDSAGQLADMVANFLDVKVEEKQELLEQFALPVRLDKVLALLANRVAVLRLSNKIGEETKKAFDERQREHVLREQLRQIQKELGESDDTAAEIEQLRKTMDSAGMPEEVHRHAVKELRRLERMSEGGGEYGMLRTYLDWLTELPWKIEPAPAIDIGEARAILNADHHGLDKVKRRILEHLAVRKLKPDGRSPILCFVGPPGVGKTSLGQSIARATGRAFQRVALGGVHDEAEIRGHRRTYIGALPGNVIQAMRRAGTRNVVLMFDEIDKLGMGGFQGDPSSALLEVLDPEQNARFRDNYLGVDFDLSRVMFICTANQLDTIPGPLRDRMEIIHLSGYTEDEKLQIAKRYLVSRQLEANGLGPEQIGISDAALRAIGHDYTREAGVRNLEREIGSVMRAIAMRLAEGATGRIEIAESDLPPILGPRRFEDEIAGRTAVPGVATGLAWTPVGGDILFIEASSVPGTGRLILTGQLGEVMKESAQAAHTLAKKLLNSALDKVDIHMHVPAGATPKDGPSAGVAMYLALVSLLTDRPVRHDVAMTGEVSLRGLVLPIGGVKEKVLAALRAGITSVMLPRRNQKDYEEVPQEARERLHVVWLERVEDAVEFAIGGVETVVSKAA
jgi:ATP-dependent Lon protease